MESARQYDECYSLAFAQQLKNKDLPEFGSKAVCLIAQSEFSDVGKKFITRKSVKAFTDSMLDLIVDSPETRPYVVDYLQKKEVLYLGPDEQVRCYSFVFLLLLLLPGRLLKIFLMTFISHLTVLAGRSTRYQLDCCSSCQEGI